MAEGTAAADARQMIEAAESGDAAGVERLIGESPDLASARGPDGISAILRARYHGHAWIAERLADAVSELATTATRGSPSGSPTPCPSSTCSRPPRLAARGGSRRS